MAMVRKMLIALVGLLLIVDAGALAYLKFSGGPKASAEMSKVVLWIDSGDLAEQAFADFKAQGYEPIVKPGLRKISKEADFRVATRSSKKSLLEPIAQILSQAGHKDLSYSDDGLTLYVGGFYKQKAEAARVVERIKNQDNIVFDVIVGTKMVDKPSFKVVLPSVPSNFVEDLVKDNTEKLKIVAHSHTPVAPPKPTAATEDE